MLGWCMCYVCQLGLILNYVLLPCHNVELICYASLFLYWYFIMYFLHYDLLMIEND
jgi:hypothetical protein